jgi:ABC-type uncharacterized transport system permease subunit
VPLIFTPALAGLFSERAGIFDIGLEGKMLGSAFAAGASPIRHRLGLARPRRRHPLLGALALVHGFASITHRGNQIVSGVAINFIAAGITIVLGQAWFGRAGARRRCRRSARFGDHAARRRGAARRADPRPALCQRDLRPQRLVYLAFLAGAVHLVDAVPHALRPAPARRRREPGAVDTAGISVAWLRYRAVICCRHPLRLRRGLSVDRAIGGFVKDMTAGKGYIALAALIFAKWKPVPACSPACCSASSTRFAIRLQGKPLPAHRRGAGAG